MKLVDIFGIATLLSSFGIIFSGIPYITRLYERKRTSSMPFLLFVLGDIRWIGLLHYAVLLDNHVILFMACFGTVIYTCYVVLYMYYSKELTKPMMILLFTWVYFVLFYQHLYNVWQTHEDKHEGIGIILVFITLLFFFTPLFDILHAVNIGSTKHFLPAMVYSMGTCALMWCIYGVMFGTPFVYVPTIPGILTSAIQIVLMKRSSYKNKKNHKGMMVFYLNKTLDKLTGKKTK